MKYLFSVFLLLLSAGRANAQVVAGLGPESVPALRVCCRPLPKWSGSKNLVLFALNRMIVTHIRHCYIDFGGPVLIPGVDASARTSGIHPVEARNGNKQPIPDQITDGLIGGGECKNVADATAETVQRLRDELSTGICYSCGKHYHNRAASFCYNNSNTYVYDLIVGAGMTPPKMRRAPGYRRHHACGGDRL